MADTKEQSKELKKIKKVYGEKFMQFCRGKFQPILENENMLYEILTQNFSTNCRMISEKLSKLGSDAEQAFIDFIYSISERETLEKPQTVEAEKVTDKTPYELLAEAGYELIECKTPEEVQTFKKYYAPGEELCTFNDVERTDTHVVFFAVRKDADTINRDDYTNPEREDEYSTSVLGIQFNKEGVCRASIKSRYNHTVVNPDNTYRNQLDKIAPGLESSFITLLSERGLNFDKSAVAQLELPTFVLGTDNKYYEYNMALGTNIYCCPGNIVVRDRVPQKVGEPEQVILMDNFVLDLVNKTITNVNEDKKHDCFVDAFEHIEQITVEKDSTKGTKKISIRNQGETEPVIIEVDSTNQIVGYSNNSLTEIQDDFMSDNRMLKALNIPNVTQIGDNCLMKNISLTEFCMPNLISVGNNCMRNNPHALQRFEAPLLEKIGEHFLYNNNSLQHFDAPALIHLGDFSLSRSTNLKEINTPNLITIGNYCLHNNNCLQKFNAPNLEKIGDHVLEWNHSLKELDTSKITELGTDSFKRNTKISRKLTRQIYNAKMKDSNPNSLNEPGIMIIRNQKRPEVTPLDIVRLDQSRSITTQEINAVGGMLAIDKTQDISKGGDKLDI